MKTKTFSIFTRIRILVFALITVLGILFMALTYYTTTHYHLASTQLLNKDVATHIAKCLMIRMALIKGRQTLCLKIP